MFDNVIQWVRRRTREEWLTFPRENVMTARIWIQEHPEQGFVVGLVGGVVLVVFFRLFLIALLLAVLVFAGIVYLAVPSTPHEGGEG